MIKTKRKILKGTSNSKTITNFRTQVRSRHPSHSPLRRSLPLLPFRSVVRFGSTTELLGNYVELNSVNSVKISSSKLLMKRAFDKAKIKTATWCEGSQVDTQLREGRLKFPIILKQHFGSRGTGNTKLNTAEEWNSWKRGKDLSHYIAEQFYSYLREYRLHVSKNGCFYTCRKMLKEGTPEKEKWHRHDSNSVWILEENPLFDKPSTWKEIEKDCVNALKAIGADILAFDVKVQGKTSKNPEWIIIESNSAPSFGEVTLEKYKEVIPQLLKEKYKKN